MAAIIPNVGYCVLYVQEMKEIATVYFIEFARNVEYSGARRSKGNCPSAHSPIHCSRNPVLNLKRPAPDHTEAEIEAYSRIAQENELRKEVEQSEVESKKNLAYSGPSKLPKSLPTETQHPLLPTMPQHRRLTFMMTMTSPSRTGHPNHQITNT